MRNVRGGAGGSGSDVAVQQRHATHEENEHGRHRGAVSPVPGAGGTEEGAAAHSTAGGRPASTSGTHRRMTYAAAVKNRGPRWEQPTWKP